MRPVDRLAPAADLMTGMMARLGKVAVDQGEMATRTRAQMLRTMVCRCAACPDPAACAALQRTMQRLDAPPLFCPNADALMALPGA